jgi:hypothetical protein
MSKTYTGGCHCDAFRYEVQLDLSGAMATKCNCSFCLKSNFLTIPVPGDGSQFKLLSPKSLDEVGDYRFGSKKGSHYYCKDCGIYLVNKPPMPLELNGEKVGLFVNAVTLDQGQDVDLRKFKIMYWDGKENNWAAGLKEEPYDGGCY